MLKERARKMRGDGFTLNEIVREINIPKTTVWGWIKSVELTEDQKSKINEFDGNKRKVASQKIATVAMVKKFAILREEATQAGYDYVNSFDSMPIDLVAATMLYWAEGSKTQHLALANSNKDMVKLFIDFMVKHLSIDNQQIRIQLNFYDNVHTQVEVESFWLEFLMLPSSCLYKSQVNKKPNETAGTKVGRLPFGVCTVSQSSKYKRYQIDGMIKAVLERIKLAA